MREILPVDAVLPDILAAISTGANAIIRAEPGAGKTTRVPPALLALGTKRVLVLEPRRLAARLSASRVAQEMGEALGGTVGYHVRHESCQGSGTRLLFLTEGIFLRQAAADPNLDQVDAVVLDEFHERHLHTDLALAIVRRLQERPRARPLQLVIMSATMDTQALAQHLPDAAVFDVPGRTFPVAIGYQPPEATESNEESVARAVRQLTADARCPGDILVFLTGIAAIRRCMAHLESSDLGAVCDILPLTADLSPAEQARAFAPSARRRVILATNVAETSVTLPNVTGVIDAGMAKIAGFASWSGMPTLDTKKISQAACTQRSGRAGRVRAGVALRLFSEADFRGRAAFTMPEIRRLDLAEIYVTVAALRHAWGEPPADLASALPWLEKPLPEAVISARQLLSFLGALTPEGNLTPLGMRMAQLPAHPRLAAVALRGLDLGLGTAALAVAGLIGERGILGHQAPAVLHEDSDVHFQLQVLQCVATKRPLPYAAVDQSLDRATCQRVVQFTTQLAGILRLPAPNWSRILDRVEPDNLAACLLAGFPDRVAVRRPLGAVRGGASGSKEAGATYNFCLGRGGIIAPSSVVRNAEFLVVLDAAESQARAADRGTHIYMASAVSAEVLTTAPGDFLTISVLPIWVDAAERVDIVERSQYGQLVLKEERIPVTSARLNMAEELLREKLKEVWPKPFPDGSDLDTYHARRATILALARPEAGDTVDLPEFSSEMLELLQAAICDGKRSFKEILAEPLHAHIDAQLDAFQRQILGEFAPLFITLSNGRRLPIIYEMGRSPVCSGFIQDFFGLRASPSLARGRIGLTLQLLAPNRRPVQLTTDLVGFWQRTYPDLRVEYSRRYPRHYWPEDPSNARPMLHLPRSTTRG